MGIIYTIKFLKKYIKTIFPLVDEELAHWKTEALKCPDKLLSSMALSSIEKKGFHCQGGCSYAMYPGVDARETIKLITAYQTISDYLDNLCDRAGVEDEKAFRTLHISMTDALDPSETVHDYYGDYPNKDDGGYLFKLVQECKRGIGNLPSYDVVRDNATELANLYCGLQIFKHLSLDTRQNKLFTWVEPIMKDYPGIMPWEFWAASGSTLGIFMLFALASKPYLASGEVQLINKAYFPWICGLHILLDYFIDYNEDMENNDLNFVQYYRDTDETFTRLNLFIKTSYKQSLELYYPKFHTMVIHGLLAMYLSDDKALSDNLKCITSSILRSNDLKVRLMYKLCGKLRNMHII